MSTTSNIIKEELNREVWLEHRKELEQKKSRYKLKLNDRKHLSGIDVGIEAFGVLLKMCGIYRKGIKNAKSIRLNQFELHFKNLPDQFDNYKILHLTDLHIDTIPGFEDVLLHKVKETNCDICFWTGDYRKYTSGAYEHIFPALKKIAQNINVADGIYATLGNHDSYKMVPHLEALGIKLLINESVIVEKGTQNILITGTDDPHYYPSENHISALKTEKHLYKIALIHSPELFEEAAENGYDLYLCGHTHAGQICLPGGYPPIKNLKKGREYANGLWNYNNMTGYTSPGCGVSGLPVRYNSQGEITVIQLKKST
jgi:hypothetical protein